MRLGVALALVLALSATAHADPVPITVAPFAGRCFDAAALAERVRARVEAPVRIGEAPRGSHQFVRVSESAGHVRIDFTARDERGQIVGSAHRVVPDADCAAALDVCALIVARAALPLSAEPTADSRQSTGRKKPPTPPTPVPPASSPPPEPQPAPPPAPAPAAKPQIIYIERPAPAPTLSPQLSTLNSPGTITLRTRGPEKRVVGELGVAVYGAFGIDGSGADEPAGELSIGLRRGRFGAALRGAVEGEYTVAAPTTTSRIDLHLRRSEIALEAHADVPLRVGALRFVVGPAVPLWTVRPAGVPHPTSSVIASFAITARILYRLDIGRIFLSAGVTCETSVLREQLTVTGVGIVARTPLFEVGPILGFGVNL